MQAFWWDWRSEEQVWKSPCVPEKIYLFFFRLKFHILILGKLEKEKRPPLNRLPKSQYPSVRRDELCPSIFTKLTPKAWGRYLCTMVHLGRTQRSPRKRLGGCSTDTALNVPPRALHTTASQGLHQASRFALVSWENLQRCRNGQSSTESPQQPPRTKGLREISSSLLKTPEMATKLLRKHDSTGSIGHTGFRCHLPLFQGVWGHYLLNPAPRRPTPAAWAACPSFLQ